MISIPEDFDLISYNYSLPTEQIAQEPTPKRDSSKLLVLDRTDINTVHTFADLPDILPKNALLVANNSRVFPARIYGNKVSGGRVQFLLLTPLPLLVPQPGEEGRKEAEAIGLLRASKRIRKDEQITFDINLSLTVIGLDAFGRYRVKLSWRGDLGSLFQRLGHMPLPPYITRTDTLEDYERYQTIYSDPNKFGSIAAPTAGLHFTPELIHRLLSAGFDWAEVTLYVGYGTFSPVRCPDIREHKMHTEWIEIPKTTAHAIQQAKDKGRQVIAIGTSSARSLEGMLQAKGCIAAFCGETDIFIKPGYHFGIVDSLLTNFHLPKSSLLIMVAALAGRKRILEAYVQALASGFRFFSYGDTMLIR